MHGIVSQGWEAHTMKLDQISKASIGTAGSVPTICDAASRSGLHTSAPNVAELRATTPSYDPLFVVGSSVLRGEWDYPRATVFQEVRDGGDVANECPECGFAWEWHWTDSDHDTRVFDRESLDVDYTWQGTNELVCGGCGHHFAEYVAPKKSVDELKLEAAARMFSALDAALWGGR